VLIIFRDGSTVCRQLNHPGSKNLITTQLGCEQQPFHHKPNVLILMTPSRYYCSYYYPHNTVTKRKKHEKTYSNVGVLKNGLEVIACLYCQLTSGC